MKRRLWYDITNMHALILEIDLTALSNYKHYYEPFHLLAAATHVLSFWLLYSITREFKGRECQYHVILILVAQRRERSSLWSCLIHHISYTVRFSRVKKMMRLFFPCTWQPLWSRNSLNQTHILWQYTFKAWISTSVVQHGSKKDILCNIPPQLTRFAPSAEAEHLKYEV